VKEATRKLLAKAQRAISAAETLPASGDTDGIEAAIDENDVRALIEQARDFLSTAHSIANRAGLGGNHDS
jgi:hypothetical protein